MKRPVERWFVALYLLSLCVTDAVELQGAYNLGQWIEKKYGPDSIAMLVDEGNGMKEVWGQVSLTHS